MELLELQYSIIYLSNHVRTLYNTNLKAKLFYQYWAVVYLKLFANYLMVFLIKLVIFGGNHVSDKGLEVC